MSDSPKNVLSINEGQNKKLPEGHINILWGYWKYKKSILISKYMNSEFIVVTSAEQILDTSFE